MYISPSPQPLSRRERGPPVRPGRLLTADGQHPGGAATTPYVLRCAYDNGAVFCHCHLVQISGVFDEFPTALEPAHVAVERVRPRVVIAFAALPAVHSDVVDNDPVDPDALLVLDLDQSVDCSIVEAREVPAIEIWGGCPVSVPEEALPADVGYNPHTVSDLVGNRIHVFRHNHVG